MNTQRGMVLVTVLWVVLIVSLLAFSLASSVRAELATTQGSFDSERAFFMAKGAAETVFYGIVKNQDITQSSSVREEKGTFIFPFETGEVRVRLESDAGKINLNSAPDKLIEAMLDSLGLEQQQRNQVVDSILDWRDADDVPHPYGAEVRDYAAGNLASESSPQLPRNEAFQAVDELRLVKNMTPDIFYGRLAIDPATGRYVRFPGVRDLVTVASGSEFININLAAPEVLSALPRITSELTDAIVLERDKERFTGSGDLVNRVPAMSDVEALQYLSFDDLEPSSVTAKATIQNSGISRTVRILYKRERFIRLVSSNPMQYGYFFENKFDRWQFQ